ncbi:hypothetical protein FDG95_gp396 [Pectobacterium phage vB_PcaM_CBB]|uniref:Uncharacterized protein n=1 Tax=Pectobacterium phage vB_PcaM_CBB TaxID=2772511 RepID=A0A1L2CU98_9CAUD|nr:hypothetical protein FDG95_gp030 [Pectobacterium phage vB_PcaM_CBB]YP_009595123.1 hypothetical protein FDG95_gp396 [Pectobacterium phage vB_PcaM_CBB]AMM43595.1 hypothetical protein CBB_30 [Pectobacterium phage vB_PcaM_CBB]AMM44146.1 hypothetical protein CBB_583 [Pectobacterium phage vB_PcaM_CBB]
MEQHYVHIPSPLLFSREARLSRIKYLSKAKASTEKEDREWNLIMAKMMKRHEKQWMEVYKEDFLK